MFKKILIINRGEIAVRIIRACKELGIKSACIYSEADENALHVRLADEAYFIGPSIVSESYLNKNKLLKLIKEIKADAVHPGYGFFAENADFIEDIEKLGVVFIGPSSKSVKMMGSKTAARELMLKNNVSIVPGSTKSLKSIDEAKKIANKIGYPILLKASAGGGGKGMRKISSETELQSAFESTKREAKKAFADDSIYIEKFIVNPRHIEVQILGDKYGNYVHLFERECSIQRRHQKVIEEAPSSFIDDLTREKITEAAINVAKACNYYNAGTIEFLMDEQKNFYFLEMNTRVQVEHPVTELISSADIVKEQIAIAADNKLSFSQNQLKIKGHSIECRVYAEDAFNNFLPSTGKIVNYRTPLGPNVRIDSGVEINSDISIYYDPLIAKLITFGNNRAAAISAMQRALDEYEIAGVTTNISYLKAIMDDEEFQSGDININFIERKNVELLKRVRKTSNQLKSVASLFAAIIKDKTSNLSGKIKTNNLSANKWTAQLYE